MLIDLLICEVHISVHLLPNVLLSIHGQHQVVGVQGHPVDVTFPLRPVPPDEAVACGTHVLVVPKSKKKM